MKYIIALLLLIGSAKAQDTPVFAEPNGITNIPGTVCTVYRGGFLDLPHEKPFMDTVKCIMLCADTAEKLPPNVYAQFDADGTAHPGTLCIWRRGYVVRNHFYPPHSEDYMVWNEGLTVEHIIYLDEKKRPLKYVVWMTLQTP